MAAESFSPPLPHPVWGPGVRPGLLKAPPRHSLDTNPPPHPRRNKTALSYPLCPLLCLGRDPSQAAELQGHQDLPPTPVLVYLTDALPEPLSPGFYLGELLKGSCGFGQDVSRAPWSDPHQIPTTKGSLVPAGSSFLEEGLGPEPRRLRGGGRGILNTCPVLNYLENLGKLVLGHTTWLKIWFLEGSLYLKVFEVKPSCKPLNWAKSGGSRCCLPEG